MLADIIDETVKILPKNIMVHFKSCSEKWEYENYLVILDQLLQEDFPPTSELIKYDETLVSYQVGEKYLLSHRDFENYYLSTRDKILLTRMMIDIIYLPDIKWIIRSFLEGVEIVHKTGFLLKTHYKIEYTLNIPLNGDISNFKDLISYLIKMGFCVTEGGYYRKHLPRYDKAFLMIRFPFEDVKMRYYGLSYYANLPDHEIDRIFKFYHVV